MIRFIIVCSVFLFLMSGALYSADTLTFTDDFERPDGALTELVEFNPSATIEGGQLALTQAGAGEGVALLGTGGEPLRFDNMTHIEFDIDYPGDTASWAYDHGGIIFCAQQPAGRYGTNSCYVIDYLANAPDDPSAGRFRLGKFTNGAEGGLTTAENITDYEGHWEIDITDTTITFTFEGVEQFSWEDGDFRGGYIGFWCYHTPVENKVTIDNVQVDHLPAECPSFTTDSVAVIEEGENAIAKVRTPLMANETEDYEVTVTTRDQGVAVPAGHTDGALTLTFAAGGSMVQGFEVAPQGIGKTELYLTVEGAECEDVTCEVEVLKLVSFEEEFAQVDGPPEGWYIASDTAEVIGEELSLSAPGQPFCWYAIEGDPVYVGKMESVTCDIRFAQAALPVGAHGGLILAPEVTDVRNRGYMIDVIERETDNGFRIYKNNNDTVQLGGVRPPYVWDDQWHQWKVDFTPAGFALSVDDEEIAVVEDLEYRGGYLAFWCYTGPAGQNMFVDNISIEFGVNACPAISPAEADNRPVNPPTEFTVSIPYGSNLNNDYDLTVTSTDPAVAVPAGAVDGALTLTFPQEGALTQTFTAECLSPGTVDFVLSSDGASCPDAFATFTVREPGIDSFCDRFAQVDGPPEMWTAVTGDWQVVDEALTIDCIPGQGYDEGWLWAGSPPKRIEGADTISFTMDLTNNADPPNAVGAHGGFMFFADADSPLALTDRWTMSGYEIDWIDREEDHGYRFLRSDNGTHTVLAGPTFDQFELGTEWRVEIEAEFITFYVDDELIFEVADATYREGYFGLWAYCNNSVASIDNLSVGVCEAAGELFIRGDVNIDDNVNIADAVAILGYLFAQGSADCKDAVDTNDDGSINIADAVKLLSYLFAGGNAPPAPFESCGTDPEPEGPDGLDCATYEYCE